MQTQASLEMSIQLPCIVRFEEKTRTFVSECPPLNVLSAADTEAEAIKALQSAVVLYLQTVVEDNRLGAVLSEKGFRFTNDPKEILMAENFIALRTGERSRTVSFKVPIGLLVASHAAIS
jgi:predicted RNase H-like HicB family nuclease